MHNGQAVAIDVGRAGQELDRGEGNEVGRVAGEAGIEVGGHGWVSGAAGTTGAGATVAAVAFRWANAIIGQLPHSVIRMTNHPETQARQRLTGFLQSEGGAPRALTHPPLP
ncbi:hypothetical protein SAMD00023378_2760 [Ralstonia sp. NT80]|nr:hypothetical protein SAMD00023378_2760 [Ralstonia sp. NT80]